MQCIGIGIRRHAEELLDERMYLLQEAIRSIAGLIRRLNASNMRVEHPVRVLLDPYRTSAFSALDNDLYLSVILTLGLEYASQGADLVDLVSLRLIHGRVVLRRKEYLTLTDHGLLKRSYR